MDAPHMSMTQNELLEALRVAAEAQDEQGDGAMTMRELRAALNYGDDRLRAMLHRLKADGLVEVVRVQRRTLDDRLNLTPAYRLTNGT